jgi:Haem-NO-binding
MMHGLINRSIQCFLRDTYGPSAWDAIATEAKLGLDEFEAMLTYDDDLTDKMMDAAVLILNRSRESLLEDLGAYLVSHETQTSLRRLLRFSGANFADFVTSLEELPERGRLVLRNLELPEVELSDLGHGQFKLRCTAPLRGVGHLMVGLLRAMADDYGALVLLDHEGVEEGVDVISIQIADRAFNAAKPFHLGMAAQ